MAMSNNSCPECGHGKEDNGNRHDVSVSEVWSKEVGSDLMGYEYTCPECGHAWEELYVTIKIRPYTTATLVKKSNGAIEVEFNDLFMRGVKPEVEELVGAGSKNDLFRYIMNLPVWIWDLREDALHNAIRGYMPDAGPVAKYHLLAIMLYSSLCDSDEEGKTIAEIPRERNSFNVKTMQFETKKGE